MVYTAEGGAFAADTTRLSGTALRGWWFDPRTGDPIDAGSVPREPSVQFFPPETGADAGRDWVLVVDDAARDFGPPGTALGAQPGAASDPVTPPPASG